MLPGGDRAGESSTLSYKAMKGNSHSDRFSMAVIKITVFFFVCLPLIYLCNRYSFSFQQLSYFILLPKLSIQTEASSPISTNFSYRTSAPTLPVPSQPPSVTLRARHCVGTLERTGIIDENGVMSEEFEVGWFDMDVEEDSEDFRANEKRGNVEKKAPLRVGKYELCGNGMTHCIPCFDDTDRREKSYKRQCPEKQRGLDCLLPPPQGYKIHITWPQSRNEVWLKNVIDPFLNGTKEDYRWFSIEKDKLVFPGDGPNFTSGTDQYLDQISKMVPDIEFGHRTRIGLDIGGGISSFGASLMQRNVSVLSIPSNNVNKRMVQLALERGLPSMVTKFVTHRLLFPSQAFDFIHCATCGCNWTRDGGLLLLEVNRVLRAGGYFIWAAEPVHKQQDELQTPLEDFLNLSFRICWELVSKEGYIAIWRKTLNNSCYLDQNTETWPPLCDHSDDPDNVWYVELGPCITRLPENGYGSNITAWPQRITDAPQRLQSIVMDAQTSRNELFRAESKYWNEIIESYIKAYRWKSFKLRNVMDMRAGFGGFAAALYDLGLDCWVMNVVPVSGFNTLPVIYDRGLIGVMHDWCEPFDTYPRTYDLLHAAGLFSIEQRRCNISTIMLEMDRILRPDGRVYIRDSVVFMDEIREVATAMRWIHALHDTGEGPHASWKILICEKRLLPV